MPYTPTTWVEGVTTLGPTNLNHIEQGIVNVGTGSGLPAQLQPLCLAPPSNNMNSIVASGWYLCSSATNAPTTTGYASAITDNPGNFHTQTFYDLTTPTPVVYNRVQTSGTWSAWAILSTTGLLAVKYYNPSGGVVTKTSTASLVAVDTTNLRVTFTAPASGNVVVKICGGRMDPVSTNPHLGIMESSTVLASACLETGTTIFYLPTPSFYVSGISAGSHSYDMCFGSTNGTGATLKYGYSTSNFVDATAGAFLEVWAAP